jgi:SdrD B-like domain
MHAWEECHKSSNRLIPPRRGRRLANFSADVEPLESRRLLSTYVVNTLSDAVNPVAGQLTFRQAVADADAHAGADTISFDSKVFAAGSLHTITLTQGHLAFSDFTGATTINGPGAGVVAINGNQASRILQVNSGVTVSLNGLTLTNGRATKPDAAGDTYGGAIVNAGNLTITNSTLSGNTVAALSYSLNDPKVGLIPGAGFGGAILSTGELTVTNSTLSGNTVVNLTNNFATYNVPPIPPADAGAAYGGAIDSIGPLFLTGDTVSNNSVSGEVFSGNRGEEAAGGSGFGGGVSAFGPATVTVCTVTGNVANGGKGQQFGMGGGGGNAYGGGIWAKEALTVSNSTITNNRLNAASGASQSGVSRGGGIYAASTVTISGSRINYNQADSGYATNGGYYQSGGGGGGLCAMVGATLSDDSINNNTVAGGTGHFGGGILGFDLLVIRESTISGNSLSGGPSSLSAGGGRYGGGILAWTDLELSDSTVSGNAVKGGWSYDGGNAYGGGIDVRSYANITNSTIVNNIATGGAGKTSGPPGAPYPLAGPGNGGNATAGGIYGGQLTIFDSTISGNQSVPGKGTGPVLDSNNGQDLYGTPGIATAGGVLAQIHTIDNSIVSGNQAGGAFSDLVGSAVSTNGKPDAYNNLIGTTGIAGIINGVNGNQVGITNPKLSALGDNGGPTQTEIPLAGSPAIDAGNNSLIPAGVITDQRGFARIAGKAVDIGAVETGAVNVGGTTISGVMYNDLNGDGKRESNEPALVGWGCFIDFNSDGVFDGSDIRTFSDASGKFIFSNLTPGTYLITQLAPSGWHRTQPSVTPYSVTVNSGQEITGINFGNQNVGVGKVTGTIFNDINANGKRDAGEGGLAGRMVYADLYNLGAQIAGEPTAITDANGNFTLSGITAGAQIIRQSPIPGWRQSAPGVTAGAHLTIPANGTATGAIFGSTQRIYISGMVYNDANMNGNQDAGEAGLGGWTIDVLLNNVITETATTDSSGDFHFNDLEAGTYTIEIVAKPGFTYVNTSDGGAVKAITLSSGGVDSGVLFGQFKFE